MAPPVVFADANVLYSSALRDLLMQLAVDGTIVLRWSDAVQDEWTTAVLRDRPDLVARLRRTRLVMAENLPDACVTGYGDLVPTLTLPDPADRHVLAAAVHAEADALLTFNLKDFPVDAEHHRPVTVHPDEFLVTLISAAPDRVRLAVHQILDRLKTPPLSVDQYCAALSRIGLKKSAQLVAGLLIL